MAPCILNLITRYPQVVWLHATLTLPVGETLISNNRTLGEKLPVPKLVMQFATFYVHYSGHKSLSHMYIFSQIKPTHALPSYLRSSLRCVGLPSGLFP
jgi:hypothetical protein